jgi:peptide chain release factor 3
VVASRLAAEYGVDAVFESASIWSARWVSCEDRKKLEEFERGNLNNLSIDAGGNLAYLAPNRVNLQLTQERWPAITFHETREHAVKLND